MKKHLILTLRVIGGTLLILLGIIGLFVPIMQGLLLILAGIVVIHPENGRKLKEKLKEYVAKLKTWWAKKCSSTKDENSL